LWRANQSWQTWSEEGTVRLRHSFVVSVGGLGDAHEDPQVIGVPHPEAGCHALDQLRVSLFPMSWNSGQWLYLLPSITHPVRRALRSSLIMVFSPGSLRSNVFGPKTMCARSWLMSVARGFPSRDQ
jgi:hypothetical protein